jgi:ABC-type multidrug transport system fused ATPase/permease subunit
MTRETMTEKQTEEKPPLSLRCILRAFSSLGPYKWLVVLGNLLCFVCVAASMAMIREVKVLVDEPNRLLTDIVAALTPLFLYCVLNRVCGGLQWITTLYASNRAMAGLRCRFFARLQTLSRDFYDQHKSGWLVARNTGDMTVIGNFINFALMLLVIFLTSMGFALIEMGRITPVLLLPCAVMFPVMLLITSRFKGRMSTAQRKSRAQNSRIVADLSETARGIRVVHAFRREEHNLNHFTDLSRTHYELEIGVARLNGLFMPSVDLMGVLSLVFVVLFGSYLIHVGYPTRSGMPLTAGELAATLLYMNSILWPMRMLVEIYSMALQASAAAERVFEVIDRTPAVQDAAGAVEVDRLEGAIAFEDVSFRYGAENPWVLQNFTFAVEPGQTVALVGETGAGKSTIASLIGRYYDVTDGVVRIDGRDVRAVAQESLRKRMGVVLQQGFLFTGTILENLIFACPERSREEVVALAKQLGTDEAIAALPQGYDTEVREGGESLSLGQRQLIALTRALLTDPDILILDEPTSSLDIYSERVVQRALEEITQDRTTLIIAHRLSTVRHADMILVIGDHGILEQGNHDVLLAKGGHYAALVARSEATKKNYF